MAEGRLFINSVAKETKGVEGGGIKRLFQQDGDILFSRSIFRSDGNRFLDAIQWQKMRLSGGAGG